MEERRGGLTRLLRRAGEKIEARQGKKAGARLFKDQANEGFGASELQDRMYKVFGGKSDTFVKAVWDGYTERSLRTNKQEPQS